jgi:2-C-methyl-D-erythritol 4-phosphate cytidylyltransferase
MKTVVVIPAAGMGSRLTAERPKQFIEIDDVPILIRTIKIFDSIEEVEAIVIPVHIE